MGGPGVRKWICFLLQRLSSHGESYNCSTVEAKITATFRRSVSDIRLCECEELVFFDSSVSRHRSSEDPTDFSAVIDAEWSSVESIKRPRHSPAVVFALSALQRQVDVVEVLLEVRDSAKKKSAVSFT